MKWIWLLCFSIPVASLVIAEDHSAQVMPRIDDAMKPLIVAGEISGAVTLVSDREKILHLGATGLADLEENRPMKADDIFWIASMTKPITATAVMMLEEKSLLSLDDPVSKFIPEFEGLKDVEGKPVVVTIGQCLSHTAGLSEFSPTEDAEIKNLKELATRVAVKPVKFEPGSRWVYSQTGINTVARIVEMVSGKSFPDFLQEQLFTPLGMLDTTFYPNEAQEKRMAKSYRKNADGKLELTAPSFLIGKSAADRSFYPRANGGLFSTAQDYAKFAQMILRGGELDGRRYLQPETIQRMTKIRTGELVAGFIPGTGFSAGWAVVKKAEGAAEFLSVGSFGHGGAFGTQAWIDPVKGRAYVLMIQRAGMPNGDDSEMRRVFQRAAANES